MSDKYETEIERFINRSLEHLERKGRSGMRIIIHSRNSKTGEKYTSIITIKKDKENEEDEH